MGDLTKALQKGILQKRFLPTERLRYAMSF